jgi:hypothetical protein
MSWHNVTDEEELRGPPVFKVTINGRKEGITRQGLLEYKYCRPLVQEFVYAAERAEDEDLEVDAVSSWEI